VVGEARRRAGKIGCAAAEEAGAGCALLEGGGGGTGLHAVDKARPRSATAVRHRESIRERQQILSLHFPFATQSSNFKDISHKLSPTIFFSNIIGSTYDLSCIFETTNYPYNFVKLHFRNNKLSL
jgi:hypothetical protein